MIKRKIKWITYIFRHNYSENDKKRKTEGRETEKGRGWEFRMI